MNPITLKSPVVLIAALAMATAMVHAEARTWVCPNLLMQFECDEYRQRLSHAHSKRERGQVDRKYALLIEERKRACRCSEKGEEVQ